jgi:hypothetical protein
MHIDLVIVVVVVAAVVALLTESRSIALDAAVIRWSILTGYIERFDHGIFAVNSSNLERPDVVQPLAYLDNDRSQWKRSMRVAQRGQHLTEFCIFPKQLANRLRVLHQYQTQDFSLGQLVMQSVQPYERELSLDGALFSADEALVINQNLEYLVSLIGQCIAKHGINKVLIDEPWDSSFGMPNALERIFVAHQQAQSEQA